MYRVAIITARGGSKRIPRKNIRNFHGKPVIAYPIQAAIKSKLFDEVMVSTDDNEIAEIAIKYGAVVPFMRSPETSNDTAGTLEVLREVMKNYEAQGKKFVELCCIYPVSPLIDEKLLVEAANLLENAAFDFVVPVCRYSTPVQHSLKITNGTLEMADPSYFATRSQDLEPRFFDVGQFYFARTKAIFESNSFFTVKTAPLEIDDFKAQDVDNEVDWRILEFKYAYQNDLLKVVQKS
jgi:pseudaminic acid cytidylyltransferase